MVASSLFNIPASSLLTRVLCHDRSKARLWLERIAFKTMSSLLLIHPYGMPMEPMVVPLSPPWYCSGCYAELRP